ncbi:hypothetical protein RB597_006325 [Gaeumannomyces tritici]
MGVSPNLQISVRNDGGRSGLNAAYTLALLRRASSPNITTPFESLVIPDIQDPQHQHGQPSAALPRIQNLFAISDAGRGGQQHQAGWERRGSYGSELPPTPRSTCSEASSLDRRLMSLALSALPSPTLPSSPPVFRPPPPPPSGAGHRFQLPSPPITPLTDSFTLSTDASAAAAVSSSSSLSSLFRFAFPVTAADYSAAAAAAAPCSRPSPEMGAPPPPPPPSAAARRRTSSSTFRRRRRSTEELDRATAAAVVCQPAVSPRAARDEPWRVKKMTELSATRRRLRRRDSDSDAPVVAAKSPATSSSPPPLSPSSSSSSSSSSIAAAAARRKTGKKRGPGSNAKYPLAHGDFIVYMKVEKNLKWDTVTTEFNRALDRLGPYLSPSEHATRLPDHRRQDGAQAIFYRINEVIPVLDGGGGVRFAPDGREMDEWIKCRDEKDHGVRLPGLVDRYPERVAAMNYWFVDEQDMRRARRLAAIRERQRRELGVPTWAEQQHMKVPPERLDCQRRVKKSPDAPAEQQQRTPTATPSPARDLFSTL